MSDIIGMPEPVDIATRIAAMSPQQLEARRNEIVNSAVGGDYESLSTEQLHELAYITSALRKRTAGPPKAATAAKKAAVPRDIGDLI